MSGSCFKSFLIILPTHTQAGAFRLLSESHPPPHERQPLSADRRLRREKSPKLHLRTLLPCSLHFLSCRTSGGHHTRGDSSKMMWIRFLQSAASSRLLPPSFLFPLYQYPPKRTGQDGSPIWFTSRLHLRGRQKHAMIQTGDGTDGNSIIPSWERTPPRSPVKTGWIRDKSPPRRHDTCPDVRPGRRAVSTPTLIQDLFLISKNKIFIFPLIRLSPCLLQEMS